MHFAAIELARDENPESAIRHFMTVAAELGIRFQRLVMFGPIEFGARNFVRFQTDCRTFPPIVARLKHLCRATIVPQVTGTYLATLANGREGRVGGTLMQAVARPGTTKTFLGPAHPYWQEQFGSPRA